MEELLSSSQVRERLGGISSSTLKTYVDSGRIRKVTEPGKKQGQYVKEDVEKVARERLPSRHPKRNTSRELATLKKHIEGETDWVQANDLPHLLTLDYEMYGIEHTVDISITHKWWQKNPHMCRVLFNKKDRKDIWGYITIMPMEEKTIFKILRGELSEKEITPDDILTYDKAGSYIAYAASAVIRPEHRQSFPMLLDSILEFWCNQYPAIKLTKLYAYAASTTGWDIIKKLFFSPRYDLGENAFELDLNQRNPSRPITRFQECLKKRSKTEKQL